MNLNSATAVTAARRVRKDILLVLDLNGTLIARITGSGAKAAATAVNPSFIPTEPDFTLPKQRIYFRPHLDEFLDFIFGHFSVAVWTSMTAKNAHPAVKGIFRQYASNLQFTMTRDECVDIGGEDRKWVGCKDLRDVWSSPKFGKRKTKKGVIEWNSTNTILLDDSREKMKVLGNALILPTFSILESKRDPSQDSVLLRVMKCLEGGLLLNSPPSSGSDDVTAFLSSIQNTLPKASDS